MFQSYFRRLAGGSHYISLDYSCSQETQTVGRQTRSYSPSSSSISNCPRSRSRYCSSPNSSSSFSVLQGASSSQFTISETTSVRSKISSFLRILSCSPQSLLAFSCFFRFLFVSLFLRVSSQIRSSSFRNCSFQRAGNTLTMLVTSLSLSRFWSAWEGASEAFPVLNDVSFYFLLDEFSLSITFPEGGLFPLSFPISFSFSFSFSFTLILFSVLLLVFKIDFLLIDSTASFTNISSFSMILSQEILFIFSGFSYFFTPGFSNCLMSCLRSFFPLLIRGSLDQILQTWMPRPKVFQGGARRECWGSYLLICVIMDYNDYRDEWGYNTVILWDRRSLLVFGVGMGERREEGWSVVDEELGDHVEVLFQRSFILETLEYHILISYSIPHMEANPLNDSITSPRLLDTTLCPFSTTKKSIAHTYNNQSLYIASISKDYEDSIITECRSKLKLRKVILESVPESIKECTRRLLSRVGEDDNVLQALFKFYRTLTPMINRLEGEVEKLIEENIGLRGASFYHPSPPQEKENIFGNPDQTVSKQNELQLKVQKLQGVINQLALDELEPQHTRKGRSSFTKDLRTSIQNQNRALAIAIHDMAKLKEQKDNYFYMMNNLKLEMSRMKEEYSKKEEEAPTTSKYNEDMESLRQEKESLGRYREMFYMCREEMEHIKNSQALDATRARYNQKQIRKLKEKLLNLSSLIGRGDFQLLENQEKDAIEKIKDEINNNVGFRKCTEEEFKMIEKYESNVEYEPSDSRYHQELKIYYPTFFNLLTEDLKEFEVELKISFNKAVTADLFLKIRAILDSKYNEILAADEGELSRFTDFVFGWFERFDVNNETKRIVEHNKPGIESEYNKKQFLIGLYNPKIEKLNEILTFREFLLNQSPQDQIFYYLHCRAMFFKGSQLDHFSSVTDTIAFIQHDHILKQVGMLITKYPKQVQNIIIYNINLRRKKKFNEYFIDVAFVLRTLLEVYRAYKRQKYEKMKLVMMKLQNTLGTKQIKFVYFRELVELNFPKMTIRAISYMYRETINIYKNNKIDFFGAFYAASHEKLFIYSIKQDLANFQSTEPRGIINISALLPATLGLQDLNQSLKTFFGPSIQDLYNQNHLLLKLIKVLSLKEQNKEYVKMIKQKFKLTYQSSLLDIKALTDNMIKKDESIKNAAFKLTRAFRYRIKLYYDKFLERINGKIQDINRASLQK